MWNTYYTMKIIVIDVNIYLPISSYSSDTRSIFINLRNPNIIIAFNIPHIIMHMDPIKLAKIP